MPKESTLPETLEIPVWWSPPGGGMMYNRNSLSSDHPESMYSYIKNKLGLCPESYGILHEDTVRRKDLLAEPKEALIQRIVRLEKELLFYEEAGL